MVFTTKTIYRKQCACVVDSFAVFSVTFDLELNDERTCWFPERKKTEMFQRLPKALKSNIELSRDPCDIVRLWLYDFQEKMMSQGIAALLLEILGDWAPHLPRPAPTSTSGPQTPCLLLMRGLLEGGFSRITTLRITLIQILSYHALAFL